MINRVGGYTMLALHLSLEMSQEARVAMRKYFELTHDDEAMKKVDDYEFELFKANRDKGKGT